MAEPTTRVDTHCPYCALQCAMTLTAGHLGHAGEISVEPRPFPASQGGLCPKGWTSPQLLTAPDRLTTPLVRDRKQDPLRPATWDEAIERIRRDVTELQAAGGPGSIAVFGGGGLTNEKAYALGKFARMVLRTPFIDYNGRFCMSSAAAAGDRAFGLDRGLPFPVTDVAGAELILLVGANVAETMPPFVRQLSAARTSGGRVAVIDPRRTATARAADLHLQPLPGTDIAIALGLLHLVIADGRIDREFIAGRTSGFEAVRARAAHYWPHRVERFTAVPAAQLRALAAVLGQARSAMVLTARGAEQHSKGTDTVSAFINLALALGLPGRPGSGYGCLTGQGNGQGGREHGQKSDQLPGYRSITDPAAREHVASVWGIDPAQLPGPGIPAGELLDRLGKPGAPQGMFVFGSNPVVSAPEAGQVTQRLRALPLLVVADPFRSETAELADVVLPVAQWAEEEGTTTNLEGRVLRRRKLLDPPVGVRTDLRVLADLSAALGEPGAVSTDPGQVFAELCRASAGGPADYSGMTYPALEETGGLFWPFPAGAAHDTPRPFTERFATADGRAVFVDVGFRPVAEPVDDAFPVHLCTGRILAQYQSGTQTRRVAQLTEAEPGPFVELHPDLARSIGVSEGEAVRVESRRGEAVAPARISEHIRFDTIFMPFHWPGEGRANSLTNPALDPVSRMPEFKVCAVRVRAANSAAAGAGDLAAAS